MDIKNFVDPKLTSEDLDPKKFIPQADLKE